MKTILLAAAIAATATLFPTAPKQACAAQAVQADIDVVIAGCCKQNVDSSWIPVGRNFDKCVKANAASDNGDDVFKKTGTYWWDVTC